MIMPKIIAITHPLSENKYYQFIESHPVETIIENRSDIIIRYKNDLFPVLLITFNGQTYVSVPTAEGFQQILTEIEKGTTIEEIFTMLT